MCKVSLVEELGFRFLTLGRPPVFGCLGEKPRLVCLAAWEDSNAEPKNCRVVLLAPGQVDGWEGKEERPHILVN